MITSIAVIETVSAVRRKYNMDGIGEGVMYSLVATFFREALAEFVVLSTGSLSKGRSTRVSIEDACQQPVGERIRVAREG